MFRNRFVCLLTVLFCVLGLAGAAMATEVDCDATYCFTSEDFAAEEPLTGICITALPQAEVGTVMLGSRVLQPGDILTVDQLAQMTFQPLRTESDRDAVVTYLPIYEDRVARSTVTTISVRGKEDKAPVAEDSAAETYKNLPNEGMLKVSDPEGDTLTFSLVRQPRRGEVTLREDGSFLYTPKKNKVGVDSFTYTATDPAGHVSREATVTIQILKPTDSKQYTDTMGDSCRFAAEWMRNTGLFVGERVNGEECFQPGKAVSRGEFLAMVIKALNIPISEASADVIPENVPQWLRPYLAAAIRSGLTAGCPETGDMDAPISGAEAAVMLQNALDLSYTPASREAEGKGEIPTWADSALDAMNSNGILLEAEECLTRGRAAQILYQAVQLSPEAPGSAVFRMQQ